MKNFLVLIVQFPIRLYRVFLSPFLGARCRFYPSCSCYALQALEQHGVFKGLLLSLSRIIRCNPWRCGHFHDPVPKRFTWRGIIGYNRNHKCKDLVDKG